MRIKGAERNKSFAGLSKGRGVQGQSPWRAEPAVKALRAVQKKKGRNKGGRARDIPLPLKSGAAQAHLPHRGKQRIQIACKSKKRDTLHPVGNNVSCRVSIQTL